MTRRLTIVVVNYGSSDLLSINLTDTSGQITDAQVVVVDNFSTFEERKRVTELASHQGWQVVPMDRNTGFGGGVNAGAHAAFAAGASEVLVLNPDAHIDRASAEALGAVVAVDRLTLASPIVREPDGRVWFGGLDLYLADGTIRAPRRRPDHRGQPYVEWLSGACLLITRELWIAVGGFDEDYFLYWEDVDWSRRAVASGATLQVVADATAVHQEGGTHRTADQRQEAKSETYYYYNIRNRMLYAARHLDAQGIRRWRRTALSNAWQVLLRGGRRQFIRPIPPFRAAWRGLRDGRRIARTALSQKFDTYGTYD